MKKRAVMAVLLLVALWPFAHRILVARYDLNPWKFFGWAMYTTPAPPILLVLLTKQAKDVVPLNQQRLVAPAKETIVRFLVERHTLGKLRRPDDVAQSVFGVRKDLHWLVVIVQKMALDQETARMISTKDRYVYDRSQFGS